MLLNPGNWKILILFSDIGIPNFGQSQKYVCGPNLIVKIVTNTSRKSDLCIIRVLISFCR